MADHTGPTPHPATPHPATPHVNVAVIGGR